MSAGGLDASYRFCRDLARREARNFYYSFVLLPADRYRSMCALYAFMRHTDDLADEAGDPKAKRAALAAWRSELDTALTRNLAEMLPLTPSPLAGEGWGGGSAARSATGRATPHPNPPPQGGRGPERRFGRTSSSWPGWPALADTVRRHGIPAQHLYEVIEGVAMDVEPRPFATFDELYRYCYHVASAVGLCCIRIWGYRSEDGRAEKLAEACGIALQLTNIVRDVSEDARASRVYLPQDDLDRFGVAPTDLTAATTSEPLRRLLAYEGGRAYDYYAQAEPLVRLVAPVGRPVLRAIVGIYRALLDEIARRGYDVAGGRIGLPAWRKAAITVRSLLR